MFSFADPGSFNYCGSQNNDWNEKKQYVEIILGHTADSFKFDITSNLDEDADNESWGFRDF